MELVAVIFLISLGFAVGSFLNVCIYRLPRHQSIVWPASKCLMCGRPLRWFETIPVLAYFALGGRCRTCGVGISVVYPMVELVTPALFMLQYCQLGWQPLMVGRLVFTCAMVTLFVTDLQQRILPNVITMPGIVIGLVSSIFLVPGFHDGLIGTVVGGGMLLALREGYHRVRGEEGLGMGDVKMVSMIGAFLGWKLMLVTVVMASVLGAAIGIGMLTFSVVDRKYALPFGSFLAVGAIVSSVVGQEVVVWYVSLL